MERDAGARRRFLEEQCDRAAVQRSAEAIACLALELERPLDQSTQLLARKLRARYEVP